MHHLKKVIIGWNIIIYQSKKVLIKIIFRTASLVKLIYKIKLN
jgi:hypothetical protein